MKFKIKEIESVYNWITALSLFLTFLAGIIVLNTADVKILLIALTFIILLLTLTPKNKVEVYKFFKGLEEMEQIKKEENEKIQ